MVIFVAFDLLVTLLPFLVPVVFLFFLNLLLPSLFLLLLILFVLR
jgi:hypothetical protein